jgi:hypothetical protein
MELSCLSEPVRCEATQELFKIFMKPEGFLFCLQEPFTGPYPETYQSIPYHTLSEACLTSRKTDVQYSLFSNT